MTALAERMRAYAPALECLYRAYNVPEFLHPDPVEIVRRYRSLREREVVAFVAASLAYGRATLIQKSLTEVLAVLGGSPASFLKEVGASFLRERFSGFRHRFTDGAELTDLLAALGSILRERESLEAAFAEGLRRGERSPRPLASFVALLRSKMACPSSSLLADPDRGSACKRLHLFLKWMVRVDAVDPGGWSVLAPSALVVPVDTHMHRIGLALGLTERGQADIRTALEMTEAFALVRPDDPARYDFALTRFGIRSDLDMESLLAFCRLPAEGVPPLPPQRS